MNLDTRSTPFRTPAKIIASVKRANTRKQISVEVPSGDKGGEISVFCQLLAVAFYIFNEILDNPSADYRVIRYDQDGDNGVDPSAEGQPFGFAEFAKSAYWAFAGHASKGCFRNDHGVAEGECQNDVDQ